MVVPVQRSDLRIRYCGNRDEWLKANIIDDIDTDVAIFPL